MAPRKSTSRPSRRSQAAAQPSPLATSSKVTLDIFPKAEIPESITPDYVPLDRPYEPLTETQREKLVHELIGTHPATVCTDITDNVLKQIAPTSNHIETWARAFVSEYGPELEREINIGMYKLDTLLETHMDKAFDKFTAWALRNAFDIKTTYEVALPWQQNLDFARAEYVVTSLPNGQATLDNSLEDLRFKVEQARLLSQRLEHAGDALDRRLEIARQRKAEVGFVKEILTASSLSPLSERVSAAKEQVSGLHQALEPLEVRPAPAPSSGEAAAPETKAWEQGRGRYLNWAVGKMIDGTQGGVSGGGDDAVDAVEREMRASGGSDSVEKISATL